MDKQLVSVSDFVRVDAINVKQYGTRISHFEKFGAVVNAIGLDNLIPLIPATKEQLMEAFEEDWSFNELTDVGIEKWRNMHNNVVQLMLGVGINSIAPSDTVCVLKQAARMWIGK